MSEQKGSLSLKWEVGYSKDGNTPPSKWVPATVPGAVQLDVARAEKYGALPYAENWKEYLWMEDQFFTYRASFNKPSLEPDARLVFYSLGIDYEFDILLNKEKIFYQEGMFSPVKVDLTVRLKDTNELQVKIYPVPKHHAEPVDRTQAIHVAKPPVSYGWDWHPRLVPLGIWDETGIAIQPSSFVEDVHVDYNLSDDFNKADINLKITGQNLDGLKYSWSLKDAAGKTVLKHEGTFGADRETVALALTAPELWWPHDHGKPYLYASILEVTGKSKGNGQIINSRVGFRRTRLVMNEGAWIEPSHFPKSRSVAPIQLEINGRRIFGKGTNWVNPEIFPGIITRERYNELLDFAKEANFNILRVWGGGIVNKESFFDLCDEKGLMVWQEFPLAGVCYVETPRYLKVLEQESTSIIRRLQKHPSLAMWCGGNELFNEWSGMTDQALSLRLLNSQCLRLDPRTPFIPTSPVMGMGHGHYVFRDWEHGEEVFQLMPRCKYTAYTEFGMPSPASVDILKTIIPENELWPPKPGTSWESHHAYKAWLGNTWLCQDIIEDYFGPSPSLDVLVANGQLIQGEGYKCIYEEARRQKPYCSMAANWCYNEPWPTAANNSLISYPDILKPAFHAVKKACRPLLASARLGKFMWKAGETFSAEIWMLNDLPRDVAAGKVTVNIVAGKEKIRLLEWEYLPMKANTNQQGPTARLILPSWPADRFMLLLEVEKHPELNSEYTLAYKS
jgi:beta-mannosidase